MPEEPPKPTPAPRSLPAPGEPLEIATRKAHYRYEHGPLPEEILEELIETEKAYGKESPQAAQLLEELGTAAYRLGTARYREAKDYYLQAMEMRLRLYGKDNLLIARGYEQLAAVDRSLRDNQSAITNLKQALTIWDQLEISNNLPPDITSPALRRKYEDLVYLLRVTGQWQEAKSLDDRLNAGNTGR